MTVLVLRTSVISAIDSFSSMTRSDLKTLLYRRAAELAIAIPADKYRPWSDWSLALELLVLLGRSMSMADRSRPRTLANAARYLNRGLLRAVILIEGRSKVEAAINSFSKQTRDLRSLSMGAAIKIIDGCEELLLSLEDRSTEQIIDHVVSLSMLTKENVEDVEDLLRSGTITSVPEAVQASVEQSAISLSEDFIENAIIDILSANIRLQDLEKEAPHIFSDNAIEVSNLTRAMLFELLLSDGAKTAEILKGHRLF